MIGYWGGFEFEVNNNRVFTFNGFGQTASLNTEDQELEGKKPSTYIKGEALEAVSISVNLQTALGVDVKAEIDRFKTALYNKNPQTFVIGNKPLSQNKWLLASVEESNVILDNGGNYISASVSLSFKEWVRGGSKKADKTSGTKTKGATQGGVIDKLDGARYNPNANDSNSNGSSGSVNTITFEDSMEYRLYGGMG